MISVGANAELNKGRKTNGNAKKSAPSAVFAISPGITATHVSAMRFHEATQITEPGYCDKTSSDVRNGTPSDVA